MQNKTEKSTENLRQAIIQESEVCVRCGLCLPHCPTYLVGEVEPESPRGRIMMAAALAADKITLTKPMQLHLENCLGCMACEAMCPAKVPYHDLMVHTRELLYEKSTSSIPKFLQFLLNHLELTKSLQRFYKFYQITGLAWFFKKTRLARLPGFETYQAFMPKKISVANFKSLYSSKENLGNIAIFIGCINRLCDANTIYKTIEILNALGYNVHIPKKQVCCGAIHLHHGAPIKANVYLQENIHAFESIQFDAIITLATGCYTTLLLISKELKNTPIFDINEFLLKQSLKQSQDIFKFASAKLLLIHTPCTLKNSMKKADLLENLLKKFGVKQFKHLKSYGCCGAAGLNMLNNPELANEVARPLIEQIVEEKPDFVITANIGCQLHLQKILREIGCQTLVLHPLNLIFLT